MQAAISALDDSLSNRSFLTQVLITTFLGIPMTIGLGVAVACYCTYECVKYAITHKTQTKPLHNHVASDSTAFVEEEQAFTMALTNFAQVHPPSQPANSPAEPVSLNQEQKQASPVSDES